MLPKDLIHCLDLVDWVVRIYDAHIQNEISALCVEATAHDVTPDNILLGERVWVCCSDKDVLFHCIFIFHGLGGAGKGGGVGGWPGGISAGLAFLP